MGKSRGRRRKSADAGPSLPTVPYALQDHQASSGPMAAGKNRPEWAAGSKGWRIQVGPQRTALSLRIGHPMRDLSSLCAALGLVPTHIWKKGDERKTPRGRKLGGTRDSSYCTIRFGETSRQRLPEKIQAALSLLKPHRELLRELSSTGGEVSFFVGWFLEDNTGSYFDWKILDELVDLRIGLELDIYVPQEVHSHPDIPPPEEGN